jgi:Protein of unknown function (DUF3014)
MANDPGNDVKHSVPRDEVPYWLEKSSSGRRQFWWILLAIFVVGIAGGYWFWEEIQKRPAPPPPPPPRAEAPAQAPPATEAPPAIQHPIVTPPPPQQQAPAVQPLPPLADSDTMAREALAGLLGANAIAQYFYPDRVILRIVATVDNLPRKQAPARMMPVKPVPGAFAVAKAGEQTTIAPDNAARYAPYVALLQSLNAKKAAQVYSYFYPLFQRAYQELGYPNRYFNDRLFEAIDDLLAAPELQGPVELVQPKVLYAYADPDLEERSAGQKIMMRMGAENEAKVKAKLRALRRALVNR